jgi:hypothetical protein
MATLKELGLSPGFQVTLEEVDWSRVTEARTSRFLTMQDWCSAAHLNYASLYKWTAGKRRMKLETLERAIMVFGLDLEDVLWRLRGITPRLHVEPAPVGRPTKRQPPRGSRPTVSIQVEEWDLAPLEAARVRRGWTYRQLGESCGYAPKTVANVLKEGKGLNRPISVRSLERIAAALDVDVKALRKAA